MQNLYLKLILILLLSLSFSGIKAQNGPLEESLRIADSLFSESKYTESLEIYSEIFERGQKYSPEMLLKMAFIYEGLGNFSKSLYYLDYYYQHTANLAALRKMKELAAAHKLEGYDYSDLDLLLALWQRYQLIAIGGIVLFLFVLSLVLVRQLNNKRPVTNLVIVMGSLVLILLIMTNLGNLRRRAIILTPQTYVMKEPASGSELVEVIDQGHKVRIRGSQDVWIKIRWKEEDAWIREQNLIMTDDQ